MTSKPSELSKLPHWDLSNVYPGLESIEFETAAGEARRRIGDLEAFLDAQRVARTPPDAAADSHAVKTVVDGYLDRMNAALRQYHTLNAYVRSFVTTDSYNTTARRLLSELEMEGVRLQKAELRFRAWIGGVADVLPAVIRQAGSSGAHAFYLRELAGQSRYLMSDAEESLAAELSLSGETAWGKLQGTLASQLTVNFERNGKAEKLPITALQNLGHDPDAGVRRRAYEIELAAWESVREPMAAALNGVKGAVATLDKRRGRTDALHASIDQARIDRDTLNVMIGVMRDSFPMFRRYLRAKAKRLGHAGALPWWDLFAPAGRSERHYTWEEAKHLITTQFRTFSHRLASLAERAFDRNWIDAEPRDGKRGGAFCMSIEAVDESRILCNFDGSLDQVFTVAHELGHAFHNECHVGKTILQTTTPMTLAETASIFCETIVTDAALAATQSAEEEIAILETYLVSAAQVIVDISSRYLFEKEVFERREKVELSADDFCEIMLRCQKATYGDGLDERYLHQYMWAWKPHYYRGGLSFYNYPYAFGLLFGTGLYAIYKERGKSFVPEYEQLLASTGEGTAADLAGRFGIDIRKPEFWQGSLSIIGERIDRYVALQDDAFAFSAVSVSGRRTRLH
jgi:pepF/M3 family oligoendopeptidase